MSYLSFEQTLELHAALLDKFGGMQGMRETSLLESALAAPMMAAFGEERHKTVYDKAAAYLFHIARNHPFSDGNKRTSTAVTLAYLRASGAFPCYNVEEFLEFIVDVAQGRFDLGEISRYLKKLCS